MMENFLTFTGPARLLIIERALIEGKNKSRREGIKKILTRLVINEHRLPSSELKENMLYALLHSKIRGVETLLGHMRPCNCYTDPKLSLEGDLFCKEKLQR